MPKNRAQKIASNVKNRIGSNKSTGLKGLRLIYNQLEKSAREKKPKTELIPAKYKQLSAKELYEEFLKVNPDIKGMMATGYGSSGWQLSLTFYMDFGNFALPEVFKVPVEATATGSYKNFAMLIIHRSMPRNLPALPPDDTTPEPAPNPGTGTTPANDTASPVVVRPIWNTDKPVCFMAMFGQSWGVKVSASASFYFYKEPSDLWSGKKELQPKIEKGKYLAFMELPLALSGGATLAVGMELQTLKAVDRNPGWYPGGEDETLQNDFAKVLGEKSKNVLKKDINRWIARFSSSLYSIIVWGVPPEDDKEKQLMIKEFFEFQEKSLSKARKKADADAGPPEKEKLSTRIANTVKLMGKTVGKTTALLSPFVYFVELLNSKTTSTKELGKHLEKFIELIPTNQQVNSYFQTKYPTPNAQQISDKENIIKGLQEMKTQMESFKARLTNLKDLEKSGERNKIPKKKGSISLDNQTKFLSYIKMISSAADVGLGASAEYGAGLATGGIKGKVKFTGYRYQTFSPNSIRKPLVYTQDTVINYMSLDLNVTNAIQWAGSSDEYSKSLIGEKRSFCGMTYESVCAYWIYPFELNASTPIYAEKGSGISFGASAFSNELANCAKELVNNNGTPNEYKGVVQSLAAYLRVPESVMCKFLNSRYLAQLNVKALKGVKGLLVESSFSFPNRTTLTAKSKSKNFKQDDPANPGTKITTTENVVVLNRMLNIIQTQKKDSDQQKVADFKDKLKVNVTEAAWNTNCAEYLDALRIRLRMADDTESEVAFKIGPNIVGPSSGITLSKIENAGEEGILDLYVVRFNNGEGSQTSRANYSEGAQSYPTSANPPENFNEDFVPPVALLHQ